MLIRRWRAFCVGRGHGRNVGNLRKKSHTWLIRRWRACCRGGGSWMKHREPSSRIPHLCTSRWSFRAFSVRAGHGIYIGNLHHDRSGVGEGRIRATWGWISVDRGSKATLPLTMPRRVFKSSAKDSARRPWGRELRGGRPRLVGRAGLANGTGPWGRKRP